MKERPILFSGADGASIRGSRCAGWHETLHHSNTLSYRSHCRPDRQRSRRAGIGGRCTRGGAVDSGFAEEVKWR
jgi:hypothetical protein